MKKIFNMAKKKDASKNTAKYIAKVAVILVVAFVLIGSATIFGVEAIRIKFLNFFVKETDRYTEIRFSGDEKYSELNLAEEKHYKNDYFELKYIPEGFELVNEEVFDNKVFISFENNDKYFSIKMKLAEMVIQLDTENAIIQNKIINGNEVTIVDKDTRINLLWKDNQCFYDLYGNIDINELEKIVENFK